jgi:monothiol glutaredoxin
MQSRPITPQDAAERAGTRQLTLVDVRPPAERAMASAPVPFECLEDGGIERLLALPKSQPLAFLCHHGVRSAQAAAYFEAQGFSEVYNVVGGIEAWSAADPAVPRY